MTIIVKEEDNSDADKNECITSQRSQRREPYIISVIQDNVEIEKIEKQNPVDRSTRKGKKEIVEKSPDGSVVRIFTFLDDGRKRTTTKLRLQKRENLKNFDMKLLNEYEREKLVKYLDGIPTANISAKVISSFIEHNTLKG